MTRESVDSKFSISQLGGWNEPLPEDHYQKVRYRLDQLEYTEHFDKESLPLVARLLSDLVQTTQTSRIYKTQLDACQKEHEITREQLGPTKQELVRITQENNHLHQDLIKMADQREAVNRQTLTTIRKLESQIHDLKFANAQLKHSVVQVQDEKTKLRLEMEDALRKLNLVHPEDAGRPTNKKKLFQRLQKIDIETGLAPLQEHVVHFDIPNPMNVDILAIQEDKQKELEQTLRERQVEIGELQSQLDLARDQVSKRDRQITRLGSELEVARSNQFNAPQNINATHARNHRIAGIHDLEAAYDRIEALEIQIEALQEHIDGLEREIETMEAKKTAHQTVLVEEKNQMHLALCREQEKTKGLMENLAHLEKMVNELGDRAPSPSKPIQSNSSVKLAQVKQEQSLKRVNMLQKDLHRLTSENKRLSETIEELKKKPQEPAPNKGPAKPSKQNKDKENKQLEEQVKKLEFVQSENESLKKEMDHLKSMIDTLGYKSESTDRLFQDLKTEKKRVEDDLKHSDAEREQLLEALESFEIQINDVYQRVAVVSQERDNLASLYKQVNDEIVKLRNKKEDKDRPTPTDPALLEELKTLKTNEEVLKKTISALNEEIDGLKKDIEELVVRQRTSGSVASEAVSQLEHDISELKEHFRTVEREKKALAGQLDQLQAELHLVQSQNDGLIKKQEQEKKRMVQLELHHDQNLFELRDLKSKLTQSIEQGKQLQLDLENQSSLLKKKENLLQKHKGFANDLEKANVKYLQELSTCNELLHRTQNEAEQWKRSVQELERERDGLREEIDAITKHLNHQDREVVNLQRQLQDTQKESMQWQDQANEYHIESQRLASDLLALTRENQVLNGEMQQVCSVRDKLESELKECEKQLSELNELVRVKDEEKHQLIVNYRNLISEHERLDMQHRSIVEDSNNLRMEVISRDKRVQGLDKQLDSLTQELNKYKIDINAHEKQSGNLSKALATAERQVKQLEMDKQRLTREIQSAREVAHSIDRNKDGVQSQLVQLSLEHERLNQELHKVLLDRESLEKQLTAEKLKAERFELLLNTERTRQMQSERSQMTMKASQTQLEQQLQNLNEQQSLALKTTKEQLLKTQADVDLFKTRIQELEKLLQDQNISLEKNGQILADQRGRIHQLQDEIQDKQRVIQELISLQAGTSDSVSSRIMAQIQQTQRAYQETAEQLQQHSRQQTDSSVNSIASHATTGNNDMTSENRQRILQQQRVLDTIVQSQLEEQQDS